jgi:HK97 gp10 family phage protein
MGFKGMDKHLRRLKRLQSSQSMDIIGRSLFVAGNIIQVEAQRLITSGAVSGKNHVPSKPGQPPNQDTGVLANNIETVQLKPLVVQVSSNAEYAAPLEFGTSDMAERPYMRPARDRKRKEVKALVKKAVNRVITQSGV